MSKSNHKIAVSAEDTAIIEHYASLLVAGQDDSAETTDLRQQAKQSLLEKGLPTKKDEQWQYTSLESWKNTLFSKIEGGKNADLDTFLPEFASFKIIFVDGVFSQELSDNLADLPKGCQLSINSNKLMLPTSLDTFPALFAMTSEQTITINVDAKTIL